MKNHKNKNINTTRTGLRFWGLLSLSMAAGVLALLLLFPPGARLETIESAFQHVDLSGKDIDSADAGFSMVKRSKGLESSLVRLKDVYDTKGGIAAFEFASRRGLEFNEAGVLIVLSVMSPLEPRGLSDVNESTAKTPELRRAARDESISRVKKEIEELGGKVERAAGHLVRCRVPVDALDRAANLPWVRSVRKPIKFKPHVTTEGYLSIGGSQFNSLSPYRSGEAKVMVLDVGFEGYTELLGGELPGNVVARSFREHGGIEDGGFHGSACAQIIFDIARDADLYLANILYISDLQDALNWALEEEIDIISFSLGTTFGAGDGSGGMSDLARQARELGITWVTSAGNEARSHWGGTFNDPDGDGWHNFVGDDELLEFFATKERSQEDGVSAALKWNDWGAWDDINGYVGSSQNFDLYLYARGGPDEQWQLVDGSTNSQPGYKWPFEETGIWSADRDLYWGVAIKRVQSGKTVKFDLYIPVHSSTLEYVVPEGSLSLPADSPYVIAVGAIDAIDYSYHTYSSQGPTLDGRIKPDLVAPSGVSVTFDTYGLLENGDGFYGTSASCPHMAAAIALLKFSTPFTLPEIEQIIFARARDMGDPGPDNIYGAGRLDLRPK
jgi:subtilisin family serine protease